MDCARSQPSEGDIESLLVVSSNFPTGIRPRNTLVLSIFTVNGSSKGSIQAGELLTKECQQPVITVTACVAKVQLKNCSFKETLTPSI